MLFMSLTMLLGLHMASAIPQAVKDKCHITSNHRVECHNQEKFDVVMQEHLPKLPDCPMNADGTLPSETECPSQIVSAAEIVATSYKRMPRGLTQDTMLGTSFSADWRTMSTDPSWCPLDGLKKSGRGPVIIGGIGDSGTRGIASLFKEGLNYAMCPGRTGCNKAGDNPKFFKLSGKKTLEDAHHDVPDHVGSHPINKATLAMLCWGINATLGSIIEDTPDKVPNQWGWKAPRSVYYVAHFNFLFRGRFRMVHVIRDGRDVSRGDNQMQFHSLCEAGLTAAKPGKPPHRDRKSGGTAKCQDKDPKNALRFWAKMNEHVYNYGVDVLGKERYFPIRVEDFVLGPKKEELITRLVAFLGDGAPSKEELEKSIGVGLGHEKSYGGGKFTSEERKELVQSFGDEAHSTLKLFGYKLDDYGTEGEQLDLVAWNKK